ncbi:hypothetical protein PLICRDRAFT_53460 [Plicaturopsis crispa FD-325 SS-3]|nr:hypothetical protein PLICRDRAFT_53460 [Plicaturopsis crispa FD-325 SS-3]
MPSNDSSLNTAHNHASNAEDYLGQGLLIPASEEHYKAAEAFLACVEQSGDENTKRTLRMLYNDHCKAGKELQRRIAKLREENKDPSLPQKSAAPRSSSTAPPSSPGSGTPRNAPSPPPYGRGGRMSDSQHTVDESFMVLGQRSDPGDAFNQFWKIMEGMLDNLSQPVAFATAPLGAEPPQQKRPEGSSSSDTDADDTLATRFSRKIKSAGSRVLAGDNSFGRGAKPRSQPSVEVYDDFDEAFADDGDDSSESFCMIPSGSDPSPSTLKKENAALKAEMNAMRQRLTATERIMQLRKEQDQQLKDSIVMARREAHRAMGASAVGQRPPVPIDFGSINIGAPPVPSPLNLGTRDRETQLLRRIRELEDELRNVRVDNEKQKVMITKFRERWDKLKESAKRKKDAKAAAAAASERIVEEPEAEAEQDLEGH